MTLLNRMIGAASLDIRTYEEVEADDTATSQAAIVVLLSTVAAGIAATRGGIGIVAALVVAFVAWIVWATLTWFVGTKLLAEPTTHATIGQLMRTIGFSSAPGILAVLRPIPLVGPLIALLATIWQFVAMVVAVRQALDYSSTWRAFLVCAIGWIIYISATLFLVAFIGGAALLGGALIFGR